MQILLSNKIQVGCSTKRGADVAVYSLRNLIERDDNPLNKFFRSAWNCTNILIAAAVNRFAFFMENPLLCRITQHTKRTWRLERFLLQHYDSSKKLNSETKVWCSHDEKLTDNYEIVLLDLKFY